MAKVICRSTRDSVGCGDPVDDHDGNPARACCCCNWKHNDPEHVRDCIDCHVRRIKAQLGVETTTADVIAKHLPEHLRQPFWEQAIDRYFKAELGENYRDDPDR